LPPFDERMRDYPNRGEALKEGLSEFLVSQILLETTRSLFLSADNFTTNFMRQRSPILRWDADPEESTVRIVRYVDWQHADTGRTPEIVIRNQGTRWTSWNNAALIDTPDETTEDPDYINDYVAARATIWAISPVADEAWSIAWEMGTFFSAFSMPLIKEYGFTNLRTAGVSNPAKIRERKDYWGSAVVLALMWQVTQEMIEQQPVLAEVHTEQTID